MRSPSAGLRHLAHAVCWLCFGATAFADDKPSVPVLYLMDGGFVPGVFRASADPKVLRWHARSFAQPFDFPLNAVNAVQCPAPEPSVKPRGEYCFELQDDDVVYGDVVALTDERIEVETPGVGRLLLRRERVRRLYRWQGADSIYLGPIGLTGWKDAATPPRWRDDGGHLLTNQPGSVYADLGIPEKAMIEVELSWKRKADFVLAFAVDANEANDRDAFHLEAWDTDVVAIGESAREADVAAVQQVGKGEGRVQVQAYLDQKEGRLAVLAPGGKPLGFLNVKPKKPETRRGIRLTNRGGDVRLERLRIARWSGVLPREVREDQARVHRADGSIVYGRLTAYDAASKQFTVKDGTAESVVPHDAIADVFLAPPGKPNGDVPGVVVRAVRHDGTRVSGTLTRIDAAQLSLTCPSVDGPVCVQLADLAGLIVLRRDEDPKPATVAGRKGRLEMDGMTLKGKLVDGAEEPGAGCMAWHPDLALNASHLLGDASGRIVYREIPKPVAVETQKGMEVQRRVVTTTSTTTPPTNVSRRSMHLRSGDVIPCEVTGIDEKGVTFKSPLSDNTFVPHEKVKSVELTWTRDGPKLADPKRDRLLTLPRLQKEAPPTHLICSKNGDFLRGRLLEMDETRLKIEVRLETKEIARDRIAQIIWLHGDELQDQKAAPMATDTPAGNRVQVVRADGNRLTFMAQKVEQNFIVGTSEVLGPCRANVVEADQILLGSFIEQSAAKLAYHLWKLHHAIEPKFAQAEGEAAADGRLTGTDSPLVGQPALPFKLDLLDGTKFNLADYKGKVVVLDFWATWCGPCLQSMPLVDAVIRDFADRNVTLVAVNMEEQPEQIKATLERHKLEVRVALDRDGVVAGKYAVTAIPQTVIVDRDGKIARLFVGGGKKMADALKKALEDLTDAKGAAGGS